MMIDLYTEENNDSKVRRCDSLLLGGATADVDYINVHL